MGVEGDILMVVRSIRVRILREINLKRLKWVLTDLIVISLVLLISGCLDMADINKSEKKTIVAFCGAASKPALEEAAEIFEEKTGIRVELQFSGSGRMLSQMKISQQGDLYIPGSPDYIEKAKKDGAIHPETTKEIAYLLPAIIVQENNPLNIQSLDDLGREGVDLGICAPESCCIGLYAVEIFEHNNITDLIKPNIVVHAESCSKIASLIVMDKVDAVIGWRVVSEWKPNDTEVVYLEPAQIPRIAYIAAAVSTYTNDRESSEEFINFLTSEEGKKIFNKHGYITTEEEAMKYALNAKIGGEYDLPYQWGAQ